MSRKTRRILLTAPFIVLGLWLLLWALLVTAGHSFIAAAYHGRLPFDLLNRIIQGQGSRDLPHYLAHADGIFFRASYTFGLPLLALCAILAVAFASPRGLKKAFIVALINVLVLFAADRILGRLLHAPGGEGLYFSERVIRLRKFSANRDEILRPDAGYLETTDGLRPGDFRLRTDAHGFIMPTEVNPEPDLRVFFVGGSTTECRYVDETNRFPYVAGRRLEERTGLRVNAYNAGFSGNNSLHSLNIILNDILPLDPDLIVFMHNVNDLVILLYTGTYWNDHFNRSPVMDINLQLEAPPSFGRLASDAAGWVAPHLYARLRRIAQPPASEVDEWAAIRGRARAIDKDYVRREFRANLETFVAMCRCRGITPVLMTQENRFTAQPDALIARIMGKMLKDFGIGYAEYCDLYWSMNDDIRSIAAGNQILLIDLDREIPKSREFMYDGGHLNDKGSLLAARVIADALKESPRVRTAMTSRSQPPK